jgi:hypothetical protein
MRNSRKIISEPTIEALENKTHAERRRSAPPKVPSAAFIFGIRGCTTGVVDLRGHLCGLFLNLQPAGKGVAKFVAQIGDLIGRHRIRAYCGRALNASSSIKSKSILLSSRQ